MAPDRGRTGRYHHGALPEALKAAALALVAEHGPRGFTLKDAASATGVSGTAPYRHFRDAESLLAAIGVDAYGSLDAAIPEGSGADPCDLLAAAMAAYVEWVLGNNAAFQILFFAGLEKARYPELVDASEPLMERFTRLAEGVVGPGRDLDARDLMVQAFACAHGLAALAADPALSRVRLDPDDLVTLCSRAVVVLARSAVEGSQ